jgi:hypothetical protein
MMLFTLKVISTDLNRVSEAHSYEEYECRGMAHVHRVRLSGRHIRYVRGARLAICKEIAPQGPSGSSVACTV